MPINTMDLLGVTFNEEIIGNMKLILKMLHQEGYQILL